MKVNNLMLIGALTALSGCGQPTDNAQETAARMPKSPPVTSSVEEPGATTGPAQAAAAASDGIAKGKMLFARCRACVYCGQERDLHAGQAFLRLEQKVVQKLS